MTDLESEYMGLSILSGMHDDEEEEEQEQWHERQSRKRYQRPEIDMPSPGLKQRGNPWLELLISAQQEIQKFYEIAINHIKAIRNR